MAYKYRILSGATLLGLLGFSVYSVANQGNYEEAHMLLGNLPKLMSDEPTVPIEEPDQVDESVHEDTPIQPEIKEEEGVVPKEQEEIETPVAVVPENPPVQENPNVEMEKREEETKNEEPTVIVEDESKSTDEPSNNVGEIEESAQKAKGKEVKNPGTGVDISRGPLTVAQNPENDGKYAGHDVGDQWKNKLLDTSNKNWWIVNEKHFVKNASEDNLKTQEFRDMLKQLKAKDESKLDGSSLMGLCQAQYKSTYYHRDDPHAVDIWFSCLKMDTKESSEEKIS